MTELRRVFIVERHLLLVIAALVSIYTLAPFEFSFSRVVLGARTLEAVRINPGDAGLKLFGHWLAFATLGFVAAAVHEQTIRRAGLLSFALCMALFCLLLEAGQFLQEARHARVTDLASNIVAAFLGGILWLRQSARDYRGVFQRWGRRIEVVLILLGLSAWTIACLYPARQLSNLSWDPNFKLIIGNEVDQSEPWLGEIRRIAIHNRALATGEVQEVHLEPGRSNLHHIPLVEYDFTKGGLHGIESTGAMHSENLSLLLPSFQSFAPAGGGIVLDAPGAILSTGPASEIASAVAASAAFSVEANIRALTAHQQGPARIVSFSDSIWTRNFMLGQENADLVFRVRNGVNGENGLKHALRIKDVIQPSLQHFVAVYDHGVSAIFKDGKLLSPVLDLREPFVYLGLGPHLAGRVAGILLLVLFIGIPLALLCGRVLPRYRHLAASLGTLCAGIAPYVTTWFVGGPWRLPLLLTTVLTVLTAYPLARNFVFCPRPQAVPLTR